MEMQNSGQPQLFPHLQQSHQSEPACTCPAAPGRAPLCQREPSLRKNCSSPLSSSRTLQNVPWTRTAPVSLRLNSRQVLPGSGPKWLIFKWLLRADVPMCIPSFLLLTHFLHKQQIALLLSFWSAGGGGKSHTNDISSLFRQAGDGGYGHVPPSHLSLPRCFFWDFLL